jgi:hypothetical protein
MHAASSPAASPTGSPHTSSSPPTVKIVTATGRDDGRTLHLQRGQRLRVVLSSTYWQFDSDAAPRILRRLSAPRVRPQPAHCIPGGGCGTVTATYLAVAAGRSTVAASRSSCGEAVGCTGRNGQFRLTVVVG